MKVCVKITPLFAEVQRPKKQFEMHRSCHPMYNYFENIFHQKSWERSYRDHRRKVETAKAVVDCAPPMIHNHIQVNLKKFKKEAERLRFIERENRWLMERIAFIMRTQDACDILKDYQQRWERRERELQRIDRENRSFHERLVSCLPWYQLQRWCEDWEMEENFNNTITKFPQACCCSHLMHEIRERMMGPRKKLLKFRQTQMEDSDSDMEDEIMFQDIKQKKDNMNENKMEDKTKKPTPKKEEDMLSKPVKEEEKRKYELNEEEVEKIGSRLLKDVKSRVAKLEVELETESKKLQEVKTMIQMQEDEETGQLKNKYSKPRKTILKDKEDIESKSVADTESKPVEDMESKPVEDTKSKPMEDTESKPMEDKESKSKEDIESKLKEDIESKPMEDKESKPMEDKESKPMEETEEKEKVPIPEEKEGKGSKPTGETETKKVTLQEPVKESQDKLQKGEETVVKVKEENSEGTVLEGKESQLAKALQESQQDVS